MKLTSITLFIVVVLSAACAWGFAASSLDGTVKDQSGATISGAKLTLINTALKTQFKTASDAQGLFSFPSLSVGHNI